MEKGVILVIKGVVGLERSRLRLPYFPRVYRNDAMT